MARRRHRPHRPSIRALRVVWALPLLVACLAAVAPAPAVASTTQQSIIEDDVQLHTNLVGTLSTMRDLGVTIVKVAVPWQSLAPSPGSRRPPAHFAARNPTAYPARGWVFYDDVVRQAQRDGLKVGFLLTGPAPVWAEGPGIPAGHNALIGNWRPSASDFGAFAHAVGERYSGTYKPAGAATPLPRISWWSIWNEPNYGPDLAPQAIDGNTVDTAAIMYRALLRAAWTGLIGSTHSTQTDTILLGETAPRGIVRPGFPGNFSGTVPLRFIRTLYCVGANGSPLRGTPASSEACPTNQRASGQFRSQNPALFSASGYAVHPYEQGLPPVIPTYACGLTFCWNTATMQSDPNYADFPELGRLAHLLDHLNAVYGSRAHLPLWNTEYGWWTDPPYRGPGALPPSTAAAYMNWAEYLSYINPRIRSYDQYLLVDPRLPLFASGLELFSDRRKATFDALQMPLFLPSTTTRAGRSLLVWGCVRTGPDALTVTGLTQSVAIQFRASGHTGFTTLLTVPISNPRGYFEARPLFPRSGAVRLAWTSPTGATLLSRTVTVTVR
jgi:hypothetical protein